MGSATFKIPIEMAGATSSSSGTSGLVPSPITGDEDKFLKGDGTWSEVPEMIGTDGTYDGVSGAVPAPVAGEEELFLRGDGTWAEPDQPVIPEMSGATDISDGEGGLVPAPYSGDETKFLMGDGTWSNLPEMSGADSGYDGSGGMVPAPLMGDENKFLRGDGTWADLYDMRGATSSTDGESGAVPAPMTGEEDYFLKGDGTWSIPTVSEMVGATANDNGESGIVPAPTTTDVNKFLAGDGTYKSGGLPMVILSYGSSTWAEFEAAYNNNVIVYCRASSNSNPASGSQTRMAFMAYVNNATTPTEVEFQYYRSMSAHSATAMGDQVFVYKLNKTGGWSVTTREASIKQIKAATGTALGVSWSSNVVTLTNTMTAADMPMSSSDSTTVSSAINNNSQAIGNKINTSNIANNLTTTAEGKVLDARQGKALNDKIGQKLLYKQVTLTKEQLGTSWSPTSRTPGTASSLFGVAADKIVSITSRNGNFSPSANPVYGFFNTSFYVAATQNTTLSSSLTFEILYLP